MFLKLFLIRKYVINLSLIQDQDVQIRQISNGQLELLDIVSAVSDVAYPS